MSKKLPHPKECPRCGDVTVWFTGKTCHNCYRKYRWIPKKNICPRCKRLKPLHGRGYCNGCYNTLFHLQRIKDSRNQKRHNIPTEIYKKITSHCIVCAFNKFVELHHLDCNRNNNSVDNMVGLCPNHHRMLHTIEHGEWLKEIIERLVTLRKCQTKLIFHHKEEAQAIIQEEPEGGFPLLSLEEPTAELNPNYQIIVKEENSPVLMAAN